MAHYPFNKLSFATVRQNLFLLHVIKGPLQIHFISCHCSPLCLAQRRHKIAFAWMRYELAPVGHIPFSRPLPAGISISHHSAANSATQQRLGALPPCPLPDAQWGPCLPLKQCSSYSEAEVAFLLDQSPYDQCLSELLLSWLSCSSNSPFLSFNLT